MPRRIMTKELRVTQIARDGRGGIEASVQMALNSLQSQIQALYAMLAEMRATTGAPRDEEGNPAPGQDSSTVAVMTNGSGAGRNFGDVVVRHATGDCAFDVTAAANDTTVIGVVCSDSPDGVSDAVAAGAEGEVCIGGPARVKVDADAAAVSRGDYLVTHTTAGCAVKAVAREDAGVFAVALESKSSGVGLIDAVITSDALVTSESIAALKNFDYSLFERAGVLEPHYDADGSETGFSGYVTGVSLWTTSAMSQLIGRWTYGYSVSGLLISAIHSVYDMAGDPMMTVLRALEYQENRISKIISELA